MAKVKITGHASGSGVLTITAPNTSTDRTVTLPDSTGTLLDTTSGLDATKLSGNLPALNGASLTGVAGRKNMIINGAMQVAQRGTSLSGIDTSTELNKYIVDRWSLSGDDAGAWTMSQDTNSPNEFGSSLKIDCTTAKSSLDANTYMYLSHRIEAQNLQQLAYGTSSAKAITLSFWVKSPKTGTHIVEIYHGDSSGTSLRKNSRAYTVSTANTWEKKEVTWTGSSAVNQINNDNGLGLYVNFWIAAGSNYTSGTLTENSWHNTEANRIVGQVNVADSTSNNFYLTGVQMELGSVATDFEHRSYGEELALCHRYFQAISFKAAWGSGIGYVRATGQAMTIVQFLTTMRAIPSTITFPTVGQASGNITYLNGESYPSTHGSVNSAEASVDGCWFNLPGFSAIGSVGTATWAYVNGTAIFYFDAEL